MDKEICEESLVCSNEVTAAVVELKSSETCQCEPIFEQKCEDVLEEACEIVEKEECVNIKENICTDIPQEVCEDVETEVCDKVTDEKCNFFLGGLYKVCTSNSVNLYKSPYLHTLVSPLSLSLRDKEID